MSDASVLAALLGTRALTDRVTAASDGQQTALKQILAVVQSVNLDGTIEVAVPALDAAGASILAPIYTVRVLGTPPNPGETTILLSSGRGRVVSLGVAGQPTTIPIQPPPGGTPDPVSPGAAGSATLVGGKVTVLTSAITSSSLIYVSRTTPGGTIGELAARNIGGSPDRTPGASFVVSSAQDDGTLQTLDTSMFNWFLIEGGPGVTPPVGGGFRLEQDGSYRLNQDGSRRLLGG